MLKTYLSNLILSKVDIGKAKTILGNTSVLSIFYKIGSQLLIDYKFPTHIFIESTRVCNFKCRSCPRDLSDFKIGSMEFDLFRKIVDEATLFGSRNFCLHVLGEPLLHPQITEMAEYIKKANKNHSILLTTNGYFLDEDKIIKFMKIALDKIIISFFTLRPDRAKDFTGNTEIEKIINNVRNASRIKKEINGRTRLFIRFLMHKDNEDELDSFRSLAKDVGVSLEVRSTHNYSGVIKDNYTNKLAIKNRYPCYHLWFAPAIAWDGKIVLCCDDWNNFEVLGDVNNESLADIWQSDRMKKLRNFHLKGDYNKIPLCKECNVWTLYPDIFFKRQKQG